jgi:predicted acyl esterase
MATRTATTNVFSPPPDVQQKLDALVSDLMNLGTASVAADSPAQPLQGRAGFWPVTIPGHGDVKLDGAIVVPIGAGPFPVVILPGPLAEGGWKSYPGAMIRLALTGYIALAYTERGLGKSTGVGDVAGPDDVKDGIKVITWVLENYPKADPTRIGCMGTSYGAGMSLLIAAAEPRVKAVAALSAWADLGKALFENDTPHIQAGGALANVFKGNLAPDARAILEDFLAGKVTNAFHAFSERRSPANYLSALKANKTAILLSTFWHETIFSPQGNIDFFQDLAEPKRLLLQVGDHSCDEIMGFAGLPSRATATAYEWLDFHVKNCGQGDPDRTTVHAETMFMNVMTQVHKAASWDAYVQPAVKYFLQAPTSGRDGALSTTQGAGGTQDFTAGVDTPAKVAEQLIFTGLAERLGKPTSYATATISRENAAVWSTTAFGAAQQITGPLTVHLTVTPAAARSLIVAHLFDLDPTTNVARIVTSAPYTLGNAGAAQTIDIALHPADYRVESGHQLQLIVDSIDPLFFDSYAGKPSKVTVSTANGGSYLNLPIKPA